MNSKMFWSYFSTPGCGVAGCVVAALLAGVQVKAQTPPVAPSIAGLKQTAYIKASNPHAGDHFGNGGALEGHGLALSGDGLTMAVGAPSESSAARGINGNQNDTSLYASGAVYVFVQKNGVWAQQAYIKASNPGLSYRFGYHIVLSQDGNTMAVASPFEASDAKGINGNQNDKSIPQAGAVYVFKRSGNNWTQQAYIKASNTGEKSTPDHLDEGDQFGFSLALSADGNTLAAGAISEDSKATGINGDQEDNSAQSSGAVYVFTRKGSTWTQQAYVKPSNTDAQNLFGYSVGLSGEGNTLVAGAYDEKGSARVVDGPMDKNRRGSGALYVFTRTGTNWAQTAYLKAHNAENGDSLGYDVAISQDGNTIAGGAGDEDCLKGGINPPGCDNDYKTDTSTGAAYVFVRKNGKWSEQAFIKASHPGIQDWFASRLNISGDGNTLAVAAQLEDGNSKGINGNELDRSAEDSGALYLFTRTGDTWVQKAYMKGSNTEAYDEFGGSMALSKNGKIIAVGARGEGSAAKGINGDQNDNSAKGAGAVYVFSNQ
ncbi:MAG: FG-GAP repeat protein [Acidobacteriota bacterium]|nr:FG-GAP repeat protein [Acidobacteriota bacterium]